MIELYAHFQILFDKPLFWLYLAAVAVDISTGNIKAWINDDVDSSVGVKGSLKHLALMTFTFIFLPVLTVYLGDSVLSQGIMVYFTYQYIISIIENLSELGFPLPDDLTKHFRRLKDDGDHRGSDT